MNRLMEQETDVSGKSLEEWRNEINLLDDELLRLLSQRARIACELAMIKTAHRMPAYDARREQQVLSRVCANNQGPLDVESVSRIFRRIILETRRLGTSAMREQRKKSPSKYLTQEQRNGH